MKFTQLVTAISNAHANMQQHAANAVNKTLTIRNWLIGFYIVEYEQNGADKARYGKRLLEKLSEKLVKQGIRGMQIPELSRYRTFYIAYPQFRETVSQLFTGHSPATILGTVSQKFNEKALMPILGTVSQKSDTMLVVPAEKLLNRLSFSHFIELITVEKPLHRAFYEIECMKGNWSVRELRRQIDALSFERSGLSEKPEKLRKNLKKNLTPKNPLDIIKNIYAFEFLGLPEKDAVAEADLETALLQHLTEFILELGHGFCFEARQKRILIGDEYFFVDLVFYHRVLKCHVLVELKVDAFNHNYLGQLNTYLNYFKKEMMQRGDNPPVGILLVTNRNKAYVEFATTGIKNTLFVSKYKLQLPSEKKLRQFLESEMKKL